MTAMITRLFALYCLLIVGAFATSQYYGFVPFDAQDFAARADRSGQHFHK
jgi:hypothetical protein